MELSHSDSSDGTGRNTNRRPRSRARTVFGTLNNPSASDVQHFEAKAKSIGAIKACWQLERGESQTQHIQFVVQFKNQKDFSVLKACWPRAHFEISRNPLASYNYCRKEESRVAGPWQFGDWNVNAKKRGRSNDAQSDIWLSQNAEDILGQRELYEWQRDFEELYESEPDDRHIYWFSDLHGGKGKTWMARYMVVKHRPNILMVNGKAGDMKYAVASHLRTHQTLKMIIVNVPRSTAEVAIPSLVAGVEQLKDGIFFSSKYESVMVVFKHVHVCVFANILPPDGLLSEDRLILKSLDDQE